MAQTTYSPFLSNTVGNPVVAYFDQGAAAALRERDFFVAPFACIVTAVNATWKTAAGATSTMTVTKNTGTTAPGSGTNILATSMDFNGTANTVVTPALSATASDYTLAAGDRLGTKIASGTATASADVNITVTLTRTA